MALENTLKAGLTQNVVWVSVVDWHLKLAGKNTCPKAVFAALPPLHLFSFQLQIQPPPAYLSFFLPAPLLFPEASHL